MKMLEVKKMDLSDLGKGQIVIARSFGQSFPKWQVLWDLLICTG